MDTCFVIRDNYTKGTYVVDPNLQPLLFKTRQAAQDALNLSFNEEELKWFDIIEVEIHE